MRRLELATAGLVVLLSVWMILSMTSHNYWVRTVPGPAFLPIWISVVAAGFAIALGFKAWRKPDTDAGFPQRANLIRIVVIYAALWAVVLLSHVIGFVVASTLFLLFALVAVFRRPLMPSLITTSIIAAMVHFMFNLWLDVRLPTGIVGF